MVPGLGCMETPAMLWEMGNSAAVASLAEPASFLKWVWASMSNFRLGMAEVCSWASACWGVRNAAAAPRGAAWNRPRREKLLDIYKIVSYPRSSVANIFERCRAGEPQYICRR